MVGSDTIAKRDGLVITHMPLVAQIARAVARRVPPSFDVDDLEATGYVALIRAASNFAPDAHGGAPFSAYAREVVRGAILESVRRRHWTANTCAALDDVPEAALVIYKPQEIDERILLRRVSRAAQWLTREQRGIMAAHYGTDQTPLAEIALQLGMSVAWVYGQHAAAIAEIRTRCAGKIPVARRLAVVATKPKAGTVITLNPAARAAAIALATLQRAEVDEFGELKKFFAPLKSKQDRMELLSKSIRARYDDAPAGKTDEAQGDRFIVQVGARANESVINYPLLIKTIGAKLFAGIAKTTLKALEEHCSCSVRAAVVTIEPIGPRSLKTFERGTPAAPELPKAA